MVDFVDVVAGAVVGVMMGKIDSGIAGAFAFAFVVAAAGVGVRAEVAVAADKDGLGSGIPTLAGAAVVAVVVVAVAVHTCFDHWNCFWGGMDVVAGIDADAEGKSAAAWQWPSERSSYSMSACW